MSLSGQVDSLIAAMGASFKSLRSSTTTASSATPAPVGSAARNFFTVTAQAVAGAVAAPSGTPADGNTLLIRIKDNGTARVLTWNAIYVVRGSVTLPTTTIVGTYHYIGCTYNSQTSTWDVLSVSP